MPKENIQVAKLGLKQGLLVALISGLFGLGSAALQIDIRKPATEGRVVSLFNERLPVGTIVPSMLDPRAFAKIAGDPGDFDPRTSIWVPADKRDVAGSRYAKEVSGIVPDFRGMFLRGLNYSDTDRVRSDGLQDPDGAGRRPGSIQHDAVIKHSHQMTEFQMGSERHGSGDGAYEHSVNTTTGVNADGGSETRPKNMAVFYYIKIN